MYLIDNKEEFEIIHREDGNYFVFPDQQIAFWEDERKHLRITMIFFSLDNIIKTLGKKNDMKQ